MRAPTTTTARGALLAGLIAVCPGCAPDLAASHTWDDGGPDPFEQAGDDVHILLESDGIDWSARIDAKDGAYWVTLDLDVLQEVASGTEGWDLRFQRFHVSGNGGISGLAGVEAAFVPDATLAGLPPVPESGWQVDRLDGDDEGDDPDYALHTWYHYDQETHILTPRAGVWFVRTDQQAVHALVFDTYYDSFGNSALYTVRGRGPL